MLLSRLTAICFALAVQPSFAHEFWISPERYQISAGETATAAFRVGEKMKGASFSYIERQSTRFDLILGDTTRQVTARTGDNPALEAPLDADGLWIVVHETTDNTLTYTEWAKFERFVEHKAFENVLEQHEARGLTKEGFRESYRRFAKALIGVGDSAGEDRAVGLRTEIVALANPYLDDLSGRLPVLVLFEGDPRPNAQVELFAKAADGSVTVSLHQTDENGRAVLPVAPQTEYLVDAVTMVSLDNDPAEGPVWKSLWAALTFKTP